MALQLAGQVKRITASGGGTLQAAADQSFRIRRLFCVPSSNDTYVTIMVSSTTVAKIRVKGLAGNRIPYPGNKLGQNYEDIIEDLYSFAARIGCPLDIPVASGETLTVSRYAEAGDVALIYDIYNAADVKPEEPNGSKSRIRRYIHGGTNAAAITSSPTTLGTSLIWSGGEAWPFDGTAVPEKNVYRLAAILAAPAARGNASANKGYTTYLKLIQRNNVLFDVDANGLPFTGLVGQTADAAVYTPAGSVVGPQTAEYTQRALVLPAPLVFGEGETLTTQVLTSGAASGGLGAGEIDVAYLLEHEYSG
jgi:hypothetical protein